MCVRAATNFSRSNFYFLMKIVWKKIVKFNYSMDWALKFMGFDGCLWNADNSPFTRFEGVFFFFVDWMEQVSFFSFVSISRSPAWKCFSCYDMTWIVGLGDCFLSFQKAGPDKIDKSRLTRTRNDNDTETLAQQSIRARSSWNSGTASLCQSVDNSPFTRFKLSFYLPLESISLPVPNPISRP